MPYIKGEAGSLEALLTDIIAWTTDATIHGDDAWTLMQNEVWPKGTILKAKGLDGKNSCYIGLMILDFTSTSAYSSWMLQTSVIAKKFVWSKDMLNMNHTKFTHTNGSTSFTTGEGDNATTYTLSGYNNLVKSFGKCLVFGVFKQFNRGLDWNEQPGGIDIDDVNMYPIYYKSENMTYTSPITPPVYPGLGYPGIALPSGEPSGGDFTYWLIKDACRLTVVTDNAGQWDMGHAGMLVPFEATMQNPFPAVVAGTCTGLSIVSATRTIEERVSIVTGNKIDYSYNNCSLSRSMPSTPCENGVSQVGFCLPDGTWKFFGNWTQELKTRTRTVGTGDSAVTTYYFTVERPVRNSNTDDGYRIGPTNLELTDVAPSLSSNETIQVEPLLLIQNDSANMKIDLFGSIWGMSWPGDNLPCGEITVNGKACLMLPNCWEDRLWYVVPWTTDLVQQTAQLTQYKEIIEYGNQFRMLIALEV